MNYPIWEIPAGGLLIAAVAILHVFISHFAVGGGLFLVLLEGKARRENDQRLLNYVRSHSRFFLLVTLVLGAITGVGIWFTIGLVHPQATASLITTFVWGWAIEWTFFVMEVTAAIVYYYGWDRLSARDHLAVGWIYFIAAWLSLVVISGIISYMLTPGDWITTRSFWDGLLNPTYVVQVATRTFICLGLAGLYALLTVSFSSDSGLKQKVSRYAGLRWVVPMTIVVPLTLLWYLSAAAAAGVPVGPILGTDGSSWGSIVFAVLTGSSGSGYPSAQRGAFWMLAGPILILLLTLVFVWKTRLVVPATTTVLMLLGLAAFGGGEFVREDLRKPWVIGRYMFVNGVRLPPPEGVSMSLSASGAQVDDRYTMTSLNRTGVLAASPWTRTPDDLNLALQGAERRAVEGREVFKLQCSACHSVDGYQAIRPLVTGLSVAALEGLLDRLALPVDLEGKATSWADPQLRLVSWRERRMPPFVGTAQEKTALAIYLAQLGGADLSKIKVTDLGEQTFEDYCAICHNDEGEFPIRDLAEGRSAEDFYEQLGDLPLLNDMMPPFEGTDQERRALADYLQRLVASHDREEEGQ